MKKRKKFRIFFLVILFLAGLSMTFYSTLIKYWNEIQQSETVNSYKLKISEREEAENTESFLRAWEFNDHVLQRKYAYYLSEEERCRYEKLLNVTGTGVMCWMEIPVINAKIPVYHGTERTVLRKAAGHLEWTSLPIGGEGSHCAVSGQWEASGVKLESLREGDFFLVNVLDEVLVYKVEQIYTTEAKDIQSIQIIPGKDCFTIIGNEPAGRKNRRICVRGIRAEDLEERMPLNITAEAVREKELLAVSLIMVFLLFFLFAVMRLLKRRV